MELGLELQSVEENTIYQNLDCELRICNYEGDDTFRDLLNNKVYHIPISEIISQYAEEDIFGSVEDELLIHIPRTEKIGDLLELKPGSIAEVCLWQNQAYFAALMDCYPLDNLSNDTAVHLDRNSELIDIFIEQKSAEYKLAQVSFFNHTASWVYPHKTYSPLGCIIVKY